MNQHFSSPCVLVQVTPTFSFCVRRLLKITNIKNENQTLVTHTAPTVASLVTDVKVVECYF